MEDAGFSTMSAIPAMTAITATPGLSAGHGPHSPIGDDEREVHERLVGAAPEPTRRHRGCATSLGGTRRRDVADAARRESLAPAEGGVAILEMMTARTSST
jgi:hypothetical protein